MKKVCKYNIYKAISTILTVGTPITALSCCSDFFIHRSDTAISAAGMFALFFTILFTKDKIMENFKMPSAFIVSVASFILILMLESLIQPMKYVCIATMCACGIDELTFKRFYKNIEYTLPESHKLYKHLGFIFASSNRVLGGSNG